MTQTEKALDQELCRSKLRMIQRCINVEEYLSLHWEEFEGLTARLQGKECKLVEGLMDAQSSSVSCDFKGPITQGNMASSHLEPRSIIFGSELVSSHMFNQPELNILYDSVTDRLNDTMCGDWNAVRHHVGTLHGLIAKLIRLMEVNS